MTKVYLINFCIIALLTSSIGYAFQRYNRRFYAFKFVKYVLMGKDTQELKPLYGVPTERLNLERIKGMVVPKWQAQELKQITDFINRNTKEDETVFMYPEQGAYHFITNRPFVGRFPMATFSWFHDSWHKEFFTELQNTKPRYAILVRDPGSTFPDVYFKVPQNKEKYDEIMSFIHQNYKLAGETKNMLIYRLNAPR